MAHSGVEAAPRVPCAMAQCTLLSVLRASSGEGLNVSSGKRGLSLWTGNRYERTVFQRHTGPQFLNAVSSQGCNTADSFSSRTARGNDLFTQPKFKVETGKHHESVVSYASMQDSAAPPEDERVDDVREEFSSEASAKVLVIFGEGTVSPFQGASWEEVMQQTARRIGWIDSSFEMIVLSDNVARSIEFRDNFEQLVQNSNVMVVVSIQSNESVKWLAGYSGRVPTQIAFNSMPGMETFLGGSRLSSVGLLDELTAALPGSKVTENRKVLKLVTEAWERNSSDNICFAILVLIDSYVTPVKLLKNLRATGLAALQCMVKNCGRQILNCLMDPNCRKALECLNSCDPSDQVCSYRCIVSYESSQLEQFTLCILQKHNCLGLDADILVQPDVQAMSSFRGQPLTHDLAEDLFVGWLDKYKWSWKVVAGQNAAYDQFPNQYQIFYRGKAKGSLWYDPVFQVRTLEGQTVWRRRHYRVVRSATPGNFYFSVLDNGVVSKEFWRIVYVADDLSWGLFYYSGAAAAAGQSYTGAVLVTPDGAWPDIGQKDRLNGALEACGIKEWELHRVQNSPWSDKDSAPLGTPEDSKLHLVI